MFNRKSYLLLVLLVVIVYWSKTRINASHSSINNEVKLDNPYIQTYNGHDGKWFLFHELKSSLGENLSKYGTDGNSFRKINGLTDKKIPSYLPVFVPYGKQYTSQLINTGNGRKIVFIHKNEFLWPVAYEKSFIYSDFGIRERDNHTGVDIVCPVGTLILATEDGRVTSAQYSGDYGNAILLEHDNGYQTLYAHNSLLFVKPGDSVKKGQAIARSGISGESTGPHLHFEVRKDGQLLNPKHFISSTKPTSDKVAQIKER